MLKLYNLERLSLNSNAMWQLHPDTFNFNTKLSSISLHNNALTCLDGVFDNLIEKVSQVSLYKQLIKIDISANFETRSADSKSQTQRRLGSRVSLSWRCWNSAVQSTDWRQLMLSIKNKHASHLDIIYHKKHLVWWNENLTKWFYSKHSFF